MICVTWLCNFLTFEYPLAVGKMQALAMYSASETLIYCIPLVQGLSLGEFAYSG
jgi:hypothetical protein